MQNSLFLITSHGMVWSGVNRNHPNDIPIFIAPRDAVEEASLNSLRENRLLYPMSVCRSVTVCSSVQLKMKITIKKSSTTCSFVLVAATTVESTEMRREQCKCD